MPAYEATSSIVHPIIHMPSPNVCSQGNTNANARPPYPLDGTPFPPVLPPSYDEFNDNIFADHAFAASESTKIEAVYSNSNIQNQTSNLPIEDDESGLSTVSAASASRPDEDYRISLPARPPGFREHNERVRLQREQPVLMPMPGRGYGNMPTFNTTVNPNCPYPPVRPLHPTPAIASAPYPPPLRNQVSSAEDLPPSYNEVVSNLNNRPNMRRSNSEGNVYN
ncbi:hypothetical protein FQA39_LY03400 [Lamprigera yunnana]|nr:hypothetical protein FQA39_LY03400 [Lamprigera yunnana]